MQLVMDADRLELTLEGWEHLLAFRIRPLSVPLAHVERAEASRPPFTWKSLRAPGTSVPGLLKAGTYYTDRGKEFWYVERRDGQQPLTLELRDEPFRRLVLSIADARGWADRINDAIRR